jgi:hypothetical protein
VISKVFTAASVLDVIRKVGVHRGRPVDEIAAARTRRNVPFAFVTGYGRANLPRRFSERRRASAAEPAGPIGSIAACSRTPGPFDIRGSPGNA